MILTIGEKDAPKQARIEIDGGLGTAYLPVGVDPGPMLELQYAAENPALIVNDAILALLAGHAGGLLSLLAGDNGEIAARLGTDRTSVSRWQHGHKEMRRCYALHILALLGIKQKGGLWRHPQLPA